MARRDPRPGPNLGGRSLCMPDRPRELVNLLEFNSSYRFSIMVTADGVPPVQAELYVTLRNQWKDIALHPLARQVVRSSSGCSQRA